MPTYEFVCKNCGRQFKLFTTISGRSKAACPACQSKELQQYYKGMAFVKGGSGCGEGSSCAGGCEGCSGCH
jgi:putative FmdB family regulatory protein